VRKWASLCRQSVVRIGVWMAELPRVLRCRRRLVCPHRELGPTLQRSCQEPAQAAVTMKSSAAEKIAVFCSVFRGREDVFPRRWDNSKTGKSGYSPAHATTSGFRASAVSQRSSVAKPYANDLRRRAYSARGRSVTRGAHGAKGPSRLAGGAPAGLCPIAKHERAMHA
jgi:hypothetical protein